MIIVALSLFYYRKHYSIHFKPSLYSFLVGLMIAGVWIGLEGHYPLLGESPTFDPQPVYVLSRLIASATIIAIVEELFLRSFIARYIYAKKWEKVELGKFSIVTFTITSLYFALSHDHWLSALVTGVLLNLLIMKEKNLASTIAAHGFANLLIGLFVISTQSWSLW